MNKVYDQKIGARELIAVIMFTIGIKFKDTTPNILFSIGQTAAWMIPIISMLILFLPFFLLFKLLKKHQLGFVELIFKLFGKFIGIVISAGLFLIFFAGMIINFRGHTDVINTLFYQRTPLFILSLILIIVCCYIAKKGFTAIGTTSWLIYPVFQILMIFLVMIAWKDMNWGFLFPLAGPGFGTVIKESFVNLSIIGEVLLLTVFYSYIRTDKDFGVGSLVGIGVSCIQIAIFLIVMQLIFDYPSVEQMSYTYQQLTRFVTIGHFISHIEGLFLGFWTLVTTIHFSLYLLVSAYLLASALQMQQFQILILPLGALALIISVIPENVFQVIEYRKIVISLFSWVAIFLPLTLWVVDRWKGRLQK